MPRPDSPETLMAQISAPRSLFRQLRLPLVRLAPDGSVIEATPEVGSMMAHEELMAEIRAEALAALAKVAKRSHLIPCWLSDLPRINPQFRIHGTVIAGEQHRFEALLVIVPADGGESARSSAPGQEMQAMLKTHGLTSREAEVACRVAEGRPSPRIAAEMQVTVHTVRRHTEAVFRKLRVHNRAELARLVWELSRGGTNRQPMA